MGMLRNILSAVGFAALGAVSVVGLQAAAFHGPHGGGDHGEHLDRLAAELNLNADQQAQLDAVREMVQEHHEEKGPRRIAALLQQDALDRDAVHAEIDEQMAFVHDVADAMLDLHESLDADQRGRLQEKVQQMQALRERHRR